MAVRLKTANRADFPALWSIGEQKKRKETMPSSPDSDEMPVPDLHVGLYQCFCQPLSWSRAFASPGDFTIRMESVTSRDGEVYFNIAVVCCSVKAVRDDVSISDSNKRKSYVKYVERSETELVKLSESMALKYLGHRLMAKVPKSPSLLTSTQKRLDEYAEDVCVYLSDMLSIREIGYNGLVKLSEPVVKNLLIREFFDLSLGLGDPGLISTSSCDARIERRADERPLLPSAWLDNDDFRSVQSKSYTLRISPHEDPIGRSFSRLSDSGYDFRLPVMRSPRGVRDHGASASSSKCIRYVLPTRWHAEKSVEGAFTVEITSVTLVEGYAQYLINVLYQAGGGLEVSTVDRRYSDFEAMVCSIETKLRTIPLRHIFPAKTFFRSTDVRYLERRAAYLQLFLEKLLSMSFVGVLDQKIQMAAEPNLRKFLELPAVEWSIVPRDSTVGVTHKNGGVVGGPHRRFSTFAMSPTIGMESPPLFVFNARQAGQQLEARMPSYPVQFPFRSRSDSL
ncbi:hypothetical protein Poli38472_014003 [Pythium oligandrum]|uniref:PX domain-containing protein n=1 Tax=Pythium oligandrum TaxID=41045 RepID=A0A8K1FL24_PYTOL|nr:hypothetical protein Poli38472_014003 [Pythium oligandrum]|eukprot:TMW66691.1 hypothetical protein Poli38472_014003 [Pythium oligandrum]